MGRSNRVSRRKLLKTGAAFGGGAALLGVPAAGRTRRFERRAFPVC